MYLVPDNDSFQHHLQRANYLAFVQMHYGLMEHPSPLGNGWHLQDGLCLPVHSTRAPIPASIQLPTPQRRPGQEEDEDSSDCEDVSDADSSSESDDDY